MDALAIFLMLVREALEPTGPPDRVQGALATAEQRACSTLGGSFHRISRWPAVSTKARAIEFALLQLPNAVVAERLGVTGRYVRRILRQLRVGN